MEAKNSHNERDLLYEYPLKYLEDLSKEMDKYLPAANVERRTNKSW